MRSKHPSRRSCGRFGPRRPRLVPPRKTGELAERFEEFLLVRGSEIVDRVPTYRGEGKTFL